MTLAADLLEQAVTLAHHGTGRPNQASVRRSISAAYYACFHLLTGAAAQEVVRGQRPVEGEAIRRSITHDDMKQVCLSSSRWWPDAVLPIDLATVTRLCVRLQERVTAPITRSFPPFAARKPSAALPRPSNSSKPGRASRTNPAARAFLVALVALRGFRRL